MTARDIVIGAAGSAGDSKTYIEDVFSTYLYDGNGSSQTITNGIDLAGKGGMVWVKNRTLSAWHTLSDTNRGTTKTLCTNNTNAESTNSNNITSFNSSGFSIGTGGGAGDVNTSDYTYASWTFRKAPKFFDVVTFTTDSNGAYSFSHSLGQTPGMVILKETSSSGNWAVWHTAYPNSYLNLNNTTYEIYFAGWCTPNDTNVVGDPGTFNPNATCVAYLFANDTTTDGLIQCGSFTTDSGGNATVNLGWEPQYLLVKSASASNTGWEIIDSMRGFSAIGGTRKVLRANTSAAENNIDQLSYNYITPNATGFTYNISGYSNITYIYMAIRRPMKVPTDGTKVFKPIANMGSTGSTVTTGFPYDLSIWGYRGGYNEHWRWEDRLRGINTSNTAYGTSVPMLSSDTTSAENPSTTSTAYNANNTGCLAGNYVADPQIFYTFKRAPGFFDIVCYTGTSAVTAINHSLGTVPELVIMKSRSSATGWWCWRTANGTGNTWGLGLHATNSEGDQGTPLMSSLPTSTTFTPSTWTHVNGAGSTYVAYLFASCPGVSKVGSYTGNGSSQTVNCGFANGARFVLIKRTDSTGDWYVWDTARGIVAGNDPHSSMNTTVAEVTTDDTIDPDSTGFIVNQVADTNVNVNGASYIYLAIA